MNKREAISLITKLRYKADVKKKFIQDIESGLYDLHTSFLSNPLLITIMLLTYGDLGGVPAKIHIFYEQAFETLFYRHDTWKEAGYQRKHYCDLPVDEFRDCLSSFCIASYKKSQYEFTTLAALDLIKKASTFERLNVNASDFLHDLTESVCILHLDGVSYKFTHRSFQEYFSAVFVSRGPPVDLRKLLDDISNRRGDMVIPMAIEINRNLIEREWVLPNLAELGRMVGAFGDMLRFARRVFGELVYQGADLSCPRICANMAQSSKTLQLLHTLRELYPDQITALSDILQWSEEDSNVMKLWWAERQQMRRNHEFQTKLHGSSNPRYDRHGVAVLAYLIRQTKRERAEGSGTREEPGVRDELQNALSTSGLEFERWSTGTWQLAEEDSDWFNRTTIARRLGLLAQQIMALATQVEGSLRQTKSTGAQLLD